jgi:choline dehydrogenase-like flavoprotein
MTTSSAPSPRPRVVIIGCGFGGLEAARALRGAALDVTLIDKTNHHLFQPLLYQVATAGLSGTCFGNSPTSRPCSAKSRTSTWLRAPCI